MLRLPRDLCEIQYWRSNKKVMLPELVIHSFPFYLSLAVTNGERAEGVASGDVEVASELTWSTMVKSLLNLKFVLPRL